MKNGRTLICFLILLCVTVAYANPALQTPALASQDSTIIVTSTADSGPGTLRQALQDAQNGDTITFDPTIFPPPSPATIFITSELPHMRQGDLTIDASNAGVILDGSSIIDGWVACLQIVDSDANTIQGLQITNFSGPGIAISGVAKDNKIGGDRNIGSGPFGKGNLISTNNVGISLSTPSTSLNTITGNLIGTDASGSAILSNNTGIWITEGANGNIIGPSNVIAHNNGSAIVVEYSDTVRNSITQNSIHNNGGNAVVLRAGGNTGLAAPVILDFDLTEGSASGVTCSNCTVEIFSDSADEGEIYEGGITADDAGMFSFEKGAAFTGPNLTATTTDPKGNTSQFSLPTSGSHRSVIMQLDNDLAKKQLQPKPSNELLDNRIAAQFDSFGTPEYFDYGIYGLGVKRARVAIAGLEPELVDWDKPEFSIHPDHDAVFDRMVENGLIITYVLIFWDKETYPDGVGAPCARFKTEGEIERYLDFVRFIVNHFKDRVQYYEIWNEPDIPGYCPKWIEVDDYINLVQQTVPVIRDEYPEAKIVVGGVSNLRFSPAPEYLFTILESNIMPLVDVISWHPMYGTSPEYEIYKDYYYQYPSLVQQIKDTATAYGFDGEYQADELTWRTVAKPDQPWAYSPTVAAKYFGRGILMNLGMDVGVGLGGANSLVRNLNTIMAGAKAVSLPIQIQTTVTNTISYTFSLPNSNHLVGLWTDGVAEEFDPGITTTLTLPGFTDHSVIGIDPLHGYEQQINADIVGGNLVIRDFLTKDYPIMLKIVSNKDIYLPVVLKAPSQ